MNNLKYSEILRLNKGLENNTQRESYDIFLLSNIVVHQCKEIIEYILRENGVNANVELGHYDNIVQESQKKRKIDATIIFWEVANLVDGLQYKIELLAQDEIEIIECTIKSEIEFVLKSLKDCPLVLVNKFSSLVFSSLTVSNSKLDYLVKRLNEYLDTHIKSNIEIVDLDKIIANIGVFVSFNPRYYYSSKSLYTVEFFKAYAQFIKPFFMSVSGNAKKALIFDCDNTLWSGILGEDGVGGIEISAETKNGSIFQEVQSIAVLLANQGVIIGLCSKNNPDDVEEVLFSHPDMILKDNHIAIKVVNWLDKVTNLKSISKKLNIGLDSIVFIDDSPFEVELVRGQLPSVTVFQVPKKLHDYPQMLRRNLDLFYNSSHTEEDSKKARIYREQQKRNENKVKFSTINDYLASLELEVTFFKNKESLVSRMSQMTQKTNQFNLTSRRYTEVEIRSIVLSSNTDVYAFSLRDKFGDSGVTGLCIVDIDNDTAVIDNFLMSCRVIGRNIEYVFMDYIVNSLKDKNIINIKSVFIRTMKNMQVEEFYDRCSFSLIKTKESIRYYELSINNYKQNNIKYIKEAGDGC